MYYNELLSAIENAYIDMRQSDYEIPLINKNYLINILKLVLYTNEFEFAGNHFVQRIGCSMGAVPSPSICDVRAYTFISSILEKFVFNKQVILHKRFRDDGLILFSGKLEQLKVLFDIANSEHELLKFTFEYSKTSVNFLDITIYKGGRFQSTNILDTKSYIKKTETYQFLH